MKLKKEFIAHDTGSESLLVPAGSAGFSGLVKGNKTLGVILDLLKEDTTEAQIVDAMCAKYDAPRDTIAADVKEILDTLRRMHALEE